MDLTMSSIGKLITLAAIVVVFAIAGWRIGAPQSFQTALADAGIASQPAPVAAAPAAPAPDSPATPTPQPAPAQPQGDSSSGH